MGTKQFLIGVNGILIHPKNINETLPPNIVVVSPKAGDSIDPTNDGISELGWHWSNALNKETHARPWLRPSRPDLTKKDCWCPHYGHNPPSSSGLIIQASGWLKLDLGRVRTVIGLVLQGRENYDEYVSTVKVETGINEG